MWYSIYLWKHYCSNSIHQHTLVFVWLHWNMLTWNSFSIIPLNKFSRILKLLSHWFSICAGNNQWTSAVVGGDRSRCRDSTKSTTLQCKCLKFLVTSFHLSFDVLNTLQLNLTRLYDWQCPWEYEWHLDNRFSFKAKLEIIQHTYKWTFTQLK